MSGYPVEFYDGRTSRRQAATVRLAPPLLLIDGEDGAPAARWEIATLREVELSGPGLRLASGDGEARLVLAPGEGAEALRQALPRPRRLARPWIKGGAALLLALAALWLGGPRLADAVAWAVPERVAGLIGEAASRQVAAGAAACGSPAGQAALDGLAARLAAAGGIPAPQVTVIDRKEINAFAVPGGRLVILRGLLDRATSAEEVAGVLAHETGHLLHNHPLRGLVRASGLGILTTMATGGSDLAGFGVLLASFANSRAFEREADAEGARLLVAAGLSPDGLRAFLAGMEQDQAAVPQALRYLSTHPGTAERLSQLPTSAFPAAPALAPEAWQAVRAICK